MRKGLKMRLISLCVSLLILSGCFTGEVITSLNEGMTRDQVEQVLGKPDGFQRYGNSVALKYTNKLMSGWSWDRADYYTILTDDKLTEWGSGQVRQNQVGNSLVLFAVPMR
jgi:hypothetical protein